MSSESASSPIARSAAASSRGGSARWTISIPTIFAATIPAFRGENFERNLELVARVHEIAGEKGVSSAQLALAWVLHQGDDIVPIPGTKHVRYLEENAAAVDVELTAGDLARIEEAFPRGATAGERYADMSSVNV